MLGNDFKTYRTNFGIKDAEDGGWASWDDGGVHYIVLLNVFNFEKMGLMGNDQLSWLKKDLQSQYQQTPIVVFTHVPLYALYPQWGWTTQDGASALAMLSGFDHVTVLNGAYPPDRHPCRGQYPLRIGDRNGISAARTGHGAESRSGDPCARSITARDRVSDGTPR